MSSIYVLNKCSAFGWGWAQQNKQSSNLDYEKINLYFQAMGTYFSQGNFNRVHYVQYSKSHTYEPWCFTLWKMQMCVCMSNYMLVHMSGIHCYMHASSTSGCAFKHFNVLYYCTKVVEYLYFKSRMYKSKCKSSSDAAGPAKKCQPIPRETKVRIIWRVEQGL